jgi:hypothetical protein
MEHWVTITIPEADEAFTLPIFDAVMALHPTTDPVMDYEAPAGPTHYTLRVRAADAREASAAAGEIFREALARCGRSDAAEARIIDLHAELAGDDERPSTELQSA